MQVTGGGSSRDVLCVERKNINGSHNLSWEFEMPESDVSGMIWLLEVGIFQLEPELNHELFCRTDKG